MTETQKIAGRILLALQAHGLATGYMPNKKPHIAVRPFTWVNDGLVRPDGFAWSYPFPGTDSWIAWVDGIKGEQACLHCSFNHIDTMEEVRLEFYRMKNDERFCQDVLAAIAQENSDAGKEMRLETPKPVAHTIPIGSGVVIDLNDGSYLVSEKHPAVWRLHGIKDDSMDSLEFLHCDGAIGKKGKAVAAYILAHFEGATAVDLHSQIWMDKNGTEFVEALQRIVDFKPTPISIAPTKDEQFSLQVSIISKSLYRIATAIKLNVADIEFMEVEHYGVSGWFVPDHDVLKAGESSAFSNGCGTEYCSLVYSHEKNDWQFTVHEKYRDAVRKAIAEIVAQKYI